MFGLFKKRSDHVTASLEKNQLVHLCEQTTFKTGSTLEVKPNTFAVIANSGSVLDVFPDGVYALAIDRMPKLFKYLHDNSAREVSSVLKKFNIDLYFVNGAEIEKNELVSKKIKFNISGQKIGVKIEFSFVLKVAAPDVYMGFLLKHRKSITDKAAESETRNTIVKEVSKALKHLPIDITEPDFGLLNLSKLALVKVNLSKFGINVVGLKFNQFKVNAKTQEKLNALSNANKTLDVEFKRFTNAETDEVVLEKVGTEAFLDKALPVDVINGGGKSEDVALLNINTGEDAQKEVVFSRNDEPQKTEISSEYYNRMDGMLLKPSDMQENSLTGQTNFSEVGANLSATSEQQNNKRDLFCRQCGARVGANDKFCGNCGNRLN